MFRFNSLKDFTKPRIVLVAVLLCLAGIWQSAYAAFDPVNDDTDIFLANPNIPAERPNVIIFLDNTANWSRNVNGQAIFINEKAALVSVIQNLSDSFNVGLFLFPETGNPNDNVDGSYARFGVRQMTTTNKSVLASVVNGLDQNGDKGNNATPSLGMAEIYQYFAGKASRSSFGKVKTDYNGNTSNPAYQNSLGDYPLSSNAAGTLFTSPIQDSCQKNFIIYISNGPASENSSALSDAQTYLSDVGYDTSTPVSAGQNTWMDDWAKYMANADVNTNVDGTQHVYTYTVEVDPSTTGQGPAWTTALKSTAEQGDGKYFSVSSGNSGQAIVNALNQIFQEVQAVNSVFASTTLPVSVNVRGTNLNQVYIGVFRPDPVKKPRWYGNLKLYDLAFDSSTNTLYLADASGAAAENPATGFINANATSFWTTASNFWGFRNPDQNGAGGPSDLPDGDLVEKGGVAEQDRKDWATDQTGRNLYTCTQGTTDCVSGSELKNTPFDTTNDGITNANLQLATHAVSTLTGFQTQSVTALTDSRTVDSLSTASGGIPIASLTAPTNSLSIASLGTAVTRSVTGITNNPVTQSISAISHGNGSNKSVVTVTINNHGFSTGQTVTISGVSDSNYDGTFTITVVDVNTFTYDTGINNLSNSASGGTVTTTSSIVTVTSPNNGFTNGQSVTIAGVTPTSFNGTYNISVLDSNTFTFTTAGALAPVTSYSGATATGSSTTVTATLTSAPSPALVAGDYVTISGTTPAGYSGTFKITKVPNSTSFQYTVASPLADATVTGSAATVGSTVTATVTDTASFPTIALLSPGSSQVTITGGSPAGYNGSFTVQSVDTSHASDPTPYETFTYLTTAPLSSGTASGTIVASSGSSTTVTMSVPGHDFTPFANSSNQVDIIVSGVTGVTNGSGESGNSLDYDNGGSTITATVVDANTLQYSTQNGGNPGPATGTITVRLATPTAFATVTNHGYSTGDKVTIQGATPSNYNLSDVTITKIDANTFAYPLSSTLSTAQGDATGTITVSKKSTTAYVRAVNHGFSSGECVDISGASPSAFNESNVTISNVTTDTFTYPLTTAEGDATGTISASSCSNSAATGARTDLIDWVRGQDNAEDENNNGSTTDVRASIHGDVLHSRPAVVNYNRFGNDDDVYVFYGANDGVFRAVKGGFNQAAATEPLPGHEAWGFIPEEFFGKLQRLRNNEPIISSSNKKPYFADGGIGVYTDDVNGDGKLIASDGDKVWLFISMRRGGRLLYALDVSDPQDPKFMWKKDNTDPGFQEMGETWSLPTVATINANSGKPVIIMGAGYDPTVEDVPPDTITSVDADHVYAGAATYVRSMGRGIFVLDAKTGDPIWEAGPPADSSNCTNVSGCVFYSVSDMNCSVASDVTVIHDRNSQVDNRVYVGDTCGNVWRVDMGSSDPDNWVVTKLASVDDTSNVPAGLRKFLYPPDVVYSSNGYDAVLLGSGDREHPFDTSVVNRMYMFKDEGTGADSPYWGTSSHNTLTESDLYDATSDCLQTCTGTSLSSAQSSLDAADGWYVTLGAGEKVVGNAVTLNNVTFFNTNQPSSSASTTDCTSNLGIARQYQLNFENATAITDVNIDGAINALDRSTVHAGGGYLPSPVPVVVSIDGTTHEGVISGVSVSTPPGSVLNARLLKFWYKDMEDK